MPQSPYAPSDRLFHTDSNMITMMCISKTIIITRDIHASIVYIKSERLLLFVNITRCCLLVVFNNVFLLLLFLL